MDSSPRTELIALIFPKTTQDAASWQAIYTALSAILAPHLGNKTTPTTRWLDIVSQDHSNPTATGRVGKATFSSLPQPLTLHQCKNLTDTSLQALQTEHNVELILQPGDLYASHRHPGLAVFDMDSTLIQQEVIDELARAVGKYEQCAAITVAAMRGEAPYTDFSASLRARVKLLKGVPLSIWDDLKKDIITFTPGARELIKGLRGLGWKTAVLSGGFMPLAEWVKAELGLDFALANFLQEDAEQGCLTGQLVDGKAIVDGEMKKTVLMRLAEEHGIPKDRIVAVGDGANDLKMMEAAGLGIAFHAKPKVQIAAPSRLNTESLRDVLHILGYGQEELDGLLSEN